jgi:TPR repeat protein
MRRSALLVVLMLVGLASPALAEKRVALVIGNSAYQNVAPLENPVNDAALMADTLKGLGFSLTGNGAQLNLDKRALDDAVQAFGRQVQGADVAMFYYAGHGVQIRGSNFLVPINANPTREADVDFQMVDLNLVLNQMQGSGTRLNMVILDACRNNPFGGRGLRSSDGGLAQLRAPEGTLISYATQPGNVAQDGSDGHSPYTRALATTMRRPGLDLFQTFNEVGLTVKRTTGGSQQPWVSSSPIDGDFYFSGRPGPAPSADAAPPRQDAPPPAAPSHVQHQEARLTEPTKPLSGEDVITDCDRLAANREDPRRPKGVTGVWFYQMDTVAALTACNEAMRQYPDVARFIYEAGRVAHAQKDYGLARQLYEKAAALGNAESYVNLGFLYYWGYSVDKNYTTARSWIDKAVAVNDPLGLNWVGLMYEAGNGAPKDLAEAAKYYQKAADGGVPVAMVNLGRLYLEGNGVAKDPGRARNLFETATAIGEPSGMRMLGILYQRGITVAKDPEQAKKWYDKAIAGQDSVAMNNLGWMYEQGDGVPKDFGQAKTWYEKAAFFNNSQAMANIGNLYRDGRGVPKDYAQAKAWYERSANLGRTFGMMRLGDLYLQGLGVPKDPVQARKYYQMALAAGDTTAAKAISDMDNPKTDNSKTDNSKTNNATKK